MEQMLFLSWIMYAVLNHSGTLFRKRACDVGFAAHEILGKSSMNTLVNTSVNTPVNTTVNTPVNTSVNVPVNAPVNAPVTTSGDTSVNTPAVNTAAAAILL